MPSAGEGGVGGEGGQGIAGEDIGERTASSKDRGVVRAEVGECRSVHGCRFSVVVSSECTLV